MGKKKPYGKIALTVMLALMIAFIGTASALEQEFNPGFEDKKGTLGVKEKSWRAGWINSTFMEGPTSDAFHTVLSATDPTAINRILLPDESGTLLSTGGLTGVIPLSDAKVLIGNSGGLGIEQTLTLTGDVTATFLNSGNAVASLEAGTDAQILIYNAGDGWSPDTMSGKVGIDNTGATSIITDLDADDIAANAVGASELNFSTVNVPFAGGATSGTAEVTSGSVIAGGAYAFANVDAEVANSTSISGTTVTVTLIAAQANDSVVFRVPIYAP